jgi:predicted nucleic-acid-binding Zn-ribbon protein
MMKQYLLCPKCGKRLFYIINSDGKKIFFQMDSEYHLEPRDGPEDLDETTVTAINCTGCSWTGSVKQLVKFYYRKS